MCIIALLIGCAEWYDTFEPNVPLLDNTLKRLFISIEVSVQVPSVWAFDD